MAVNVEVIRTKGIVPDMLGRELEARYGLLPDGNMAVTYNTTFNASEQLVLKATAVDGTDAYELTTLLQNHNALITEVANGNEATVHVPNGVENVLVTVFDAAQCQRYQTNRPLTAGQATFKVALTGYHVVRFTYGSATGYASVYTAPPALTGDDLNPLAFDANTSTLNLTLTDAQVANALNNLQTHKTTLQGTPTNAQVINAVIACLNALIWLGKRELDA